eukprot:15482419-Alexandrium_andersonii.AAC.1
MWSASERRLRITDCARINYGSPPDSALDQITGLRLLPGPGTICIRPVCYPWTKLKTMFDDFDKPWKPGIRAICVVVAFLLGAGARRTRHA